MKLFVPEPAITLYEHGFDDHDLLDRKTQGQQLSNLVENISDPMVIALDGEWGSGKTVFPKCWVGEHLKKDEHQAQTIYFDAFEHDFMNDLLIALIGAIDARLPKNDENKHLKKLKKVAPWLARTGFRGALAVATTGATEIAGPMVDAAINAVSGATDKQIDQFWQQERQKQQSLKDFKHALTELAQNQKLVIVIDELDRCRPDFALSMLEILKHLFHVPNVHFVLGVNLTALEHSVRARYGTGLDAGRYLKKFYNLIFELTDSNLENSPYDQKIRYAEKVFNDVGMKIKLGQYSPSDQSPLALRIIAIFEKESFTNRLSFRDINQICANAAITRFNYNNVSDGLCLIALLLILKTTNRSLYERAMNLEYIANEIFDLFDASLTDLGSFEYGTLFYGAMRDVVAFFAGNPVDYLDKRTVDNRDYRFLSYERDREGVRKTLFGQKVLKPLKSFELSNT
jgi:hypothetical protein